MPLALVLLWCLLVFAALGVALACIPRLRRTLVRPRMLPALLVPTLLLSAASAVFRTSSASGTGLRTLYGFPKPFYTTWASWESADRYAGANWLYFAGNTAAWLALVCIVAAAWTALRPANR